MGVVVAKRGSVLKYCSLFIAAVLSIGGYSNEKCADSVANGDEIVIEEVALAPHEEKAEQLLIDALPLIAEQEKWAIETGDLNLWLVTQHMRDTKRRMKELRYHFDPDNSNSVPDYTAAQWVEDELREMRKQFEPEAVRLAKLIELVNQQPKSQIRFAVIKFPVSSAGAETVNYETRLLIVFPQDFTHDDYQSMSAVNRNGQAVPAAIYFQPTINCGAIACKILIERLAEESEASGSVTLSKFRKAIADGAIDSPDEQQFVEFENDGQSGTAVKPRHVNYGFSRDDAIFYLLQTIGELYQRAGISVNVTREFLERAAKKGSLNESQTKPERERKAKREEKGFPDKRVVYRGYRFGTVQGRITDGSYQVLLDGWTYSGLTEQNYHPPEYITTDRSNIRSVYILKGDSEGVITGFDQSILLAHDFPFYRFSRSHVGRAGAGVHHRITEYKGVKKGTLLAREKPDIENHVVGKVLRVYEKGWVIVAPFGDEENTAIWNVNSCLEVQRVRQVNGFEIGNSVRLLATNQNAGLVTGEIEELFQDVGSNRAFVKVPMTNIYLNLNRVTRLHLDQKVWEPDLRVMERKKMRGSHRRGKVHSVDPRGEIFVIWDGENDVSRGWYPELLIPNEISSSFRAIVKNKLVTVEGVYENIAVVSDGTNIRECPVSTLSRELKELGNYKRGQRVQWLGWFRNGKQFSVLGVFEGGIIALEDERGRIYTNYPAGQYLQVIEDN